MVASHAHPTGTWPTHNPGMCSDWESNHRPFGSTEAGAQSTEPHQRGLIFFFKMPEMTGAGGRLTGGEGSAFTASQCLSRAQSTAAGLQGHVRESPDAARRGSPWERCRQDPLPSPRLRPPHQSAGHLSVCGSHITCALSHPPLLTPCTGLGWKEQISQMPRCRPSPETLGRGSVPLSHCLLPQHSIG